MQNSKSNVYEERVRRYGITGNGTSAPTLRAGRGPTLTRQAQGIIRVTFAANPGTFYGIAGYAFRGDVPSSVKGFTLTASAPVTSSGTTYIDLYVWDSTFTAADLTTAQYLDVSMSFAATSAIT